MFKLGYQLGLLWLFWLLAGAPAVAQQVDVSAPQKLSPKTPRFRIVGKNNDGYVVRLYGNEEAMYVYDENLKIKSSRVVEIKGDNPSVFHVQLNKQGGILYYSTHNKKNAALYGQPVNSRFLETGRPVLLDSLVHDNNFKAGNVRFAVSPDQSHLGIYYPIIQGGLITGLRMLVLDRALHQKLVVTLPVKTEPDRVESADCLVDNSGNTLLAINFKTEEEGKPTPDVFTFFLCDVNSGSYGTYNFRSPRPVFGETHLQWDVKNGLLLLCGFYEEEVRKDDPAASGIFFTRLQPQNGEVVSESVTPFPEAFIKELTGRENSAPRLYTFSIKEVILRIDGGALILAESFVRDTREYITPTQFNTPFNSYRTVNIYQYNDVVAFSMDSSAALDWFSVLNKKQVSEDDNGAYSSFLIMNMKSNLRLLYLDEVTAAGSLLEFQLSSSGAKDKRTLFDQSLKEVMLLPKLGRQVSPSEVLIPSYLRNSIRMVRIAY